MQPGAPPEHQQARQYLGIRLEGLWFADLEYSNKRITLGVPLHSSGGCTALRQVRCTWTLAPILLAC